ncbi:receptor-like protein EIX1 [Vigna unguiculata]|uniref:receptor-like protein EIX1 n=1 Tax=Vigna unguiculata TaxID=3917 RepID=UPI0010161015|nr:receptor-like protein EIX1 [Vigna unguiculata]
MLPFGNLYKLQHLDLWHNFLEANIPSFLGNLSQLQHLPLSCYYFEGNIPSQLGNLTKLEQLYLGGYLGGGIKIEDGGQWLSNLLSLTHFSLVSISNLDRSYSWLKMIAKLPELSELSLVGCSLSDHFILLSKPSKLNFSTSLSVLDLSQNTFTSPMVFQWVSNITSNLFELDLSANHLEGFTSSDFGTVKNSLRHLDLSSNNFKAKDLKSFTNICTLHSLYLSSNKFTEDLPSILSNLSRGCVRHSLQKLDLSSNHITGTLSDISVFSSLKTLFLQTNRLSGRIPEGVKLPSTLEDLSISENFFKGGIPKSFGNACALHSFDMSGNNLNVELPTIISHLSGCARYSLQELYLHMNKIIGTLPDFSTFTSLKVLYLSENKLNGEIHKDIQFPHQLEELDVHSNSLKGVLSDYHFTNMSKLHVLDLSDNSLALTFTQNWVPPFRLFTIKLRSCNLGPAFPKWLQTQNKYFYIDISKAAISDIVPKWFWAKLPLQQGSKIANPLLPPRASLCNSLSLLPNSPEFVFTFMAVSMLGAVATTTNPSYTAAELAKQLDVSNAKLVVTLSTHVHKLNNQQAQHHFFKVATVDDPPENCWAFPEGDESEVSEVEISVEDTVALPFSSGTTRLAKGVILTHKSLVTSVAQQIEGENPHMYLKEEDVADPEV